VIYNLVAIFLLDLTDLWLKFCSNPLCSDGVILIQNYGSFILSAFLFLVCAHGSSEMGESAMGACTLSAEKPAHASVRADYGPTRGSARRPAR